ncbi:hypothetical protein QPK87_04825 [Kamptonema cortianum]|nr:hypothetical protein [Geitlerinema splendidum]MDK3155900.1 hypothetical protein [Kamptonema cortianum]
MSLGIVFEQAQERLVADRLGVVAGGLDLNGRYWSDVWIDPVTDTLMLKPAPIAEEWYSSSSGIYSKLGLANLAVSADWEERMDQHWAGPWLGVKDSAVNVAAITNESFDKNRGFVLSWFSYGTGDSFLQVKCGWSDTADDSVGVAVHFWTDGRVDVFKNGQLVTTGKITGSRSKEVRRLQVLEVMLIPFRKRELLVVSKTGDGFSAVMDGIDWSDPDPEITGAGKFWFEVVSGGTQIQVAPLRFASAGFATSLKTSFLEAPALGEAQAEFTNESWLTSPAPYKIYGSPGFGSGVQTASAEIVEWDGATPFVPDGVKNEIRLKVQLGTTHEGYSPFISGVQAGFASQIGLTDATGEVPGSSFVTRANLQCPESPWGVRFAMTLREPDGFDALVPGLLDGGNRSVGVWLGGAPILDGYSSTAGVNVSTTDESSETELELRDGLKILESAVFSERIPLDGFELADAIRLVVGRCGISESRIVVSELGGMIPFASGERAGLWGTLIEAGDTAEEWLRRLMETYAPGWWYGFRPKKDGTGTEFFALDKADLGSTPQLTLYQSVEEAETVGLLPRSAAIKRVAREFSRAKLEPIATEVRVTGLDPRTGRPVQSVKTAWEAQNPALPIALRPEGWLGEIRRFTLVDPALTTGESVSNTCLGLFEEMTRVRELVEWESELLQLPNGVPLWRGDVVMIEGDGLFRINSFSCHFEREADDLCVRSTRYTAERVS